MIWRALFPYDHVRLHLQLSYNNDIFKNINCNIDSIRITQKAWGELVKTMYPIGK